MLSFEELFDKAPGRTLLNSVLLILFDLSILAYCILYVVLKLLCKSFNHLNLPEFLSNVFSLPD